jgi:hypothetical protein
MKQLKKTLLTLAALLAVTTGAWAETWDSGDCTVTLSGDVLTVSGTGAMADYEEYGTPWYDNSDEIKTIIIESGVTSIGNYAFAYNEYLESVSIPASVTSIGAHAFKKCGSDVDALTVSFAEGSTPLTIRADVFSGTNLKSIDFPNRVTSIGGYAFYGIKDLESVSIPANVTIIEDGAFSNCSKLAKVYIYAPSLTTYGPWAFDGNTAGRKIYVLSDAVDTYKAGWPAYAADIEAIPGSGSVSSGPEVDWNKTSKTGTFTMPGGNVTVSVEYYDLATLADNGLTEAVDAAAKTEAPLAVLAENAITGGTVMYYVAPDANFSQADAIALAETAWSADIPTAETIEAEGTYYVWYYIKGDDEHSDTDPQRLQVTVLPEPTYTVEFAEGTEESDKWTVKAGTDGSFQSLPLKGVKAGTKVKLKYDGDRSMLKGVKAVKKAAVTYPLLSAATTSDYGKVVCAAGHLHDAKTAVPDGCTAVGILGKVTETGHGLILALQNATSQTWNTINGWTSETTYASTTLKVLPDDAARGSLTSYTKLGSTAVSNWAVAQKSDYEAIFINLGSTTSDEDGTTYDGNVNAYFTTGVGGTAISGENWSATEFPDEDNYAWLFGSEFWFADSNADSYSVRPVLGF